MSIPRRRSSRTPSYEPRREYAPRPPRPCTSAQQIGDALRPCELLTDHLGEHTAWVAGSWWYWGGPEGPRRRTDEPKLRGDGTR